ncbi:MAG: hypothetical protein ACYC7H_09640 [Chloroflexota bacterium]
MDRLAGGDRTPSIAAPPQRARFAGIAEGGLVATLALALPSLAPLLQPGLGDLADVVVGLYDLRTMRRLPVRDGNGKIVAEDAIRLTPVVEARSR